MDNNNTSNCQYHIKCLVSIVVIMGAARDGKIMMLEDIYI